LGATTLLRTVPPVHHEAYLAALAVTAAALALAAVRLGRVRPPVVVDAVPEGRFGPVSLLAIAAGLAVLLPWAWVGALGAALETLLAGLAAAALGALAGALLGAGFWAAFGPGPARLVLVGGLVAGVALTPLAAGAGQSGVQLPALLL
ncbi:peptidase S8, partial [Micromonospora tulbaghiae]